jgi:transcriptional regulator with XRE-family HTH domain
MSVYKYMLNIDSEKTKEFIKLTRSRLGINQTKMAIKMGIKLRSYQRFETMQGLARRDYIHKFLEVAGVSSEDFMNAVSSTSTKYGILNDVHTKYSSDIEGLEEIIEAIKRDKVLFKIVLNLIRHIKTLENINK